MPVHETIRFKGGGTLLVHDCGKKTYISSKNYRECRRKYLEPKQTKSKSGTHENCFKLLAAILGCYIECKDNTTILTRDGAPDSISYERVGLTEYVSHIHIKRKQKLIKHTIKRKSNANNNSNSTNS